MCETHLRETHSNRSRSRFILSRLRSIAILRYTPSHLFIVFFLLLSFLFLLITRILDSTLDGLRLNDMIRHCTLFLPRTFLSFLLYLTLTRDKSMGIYRTMLSHYCHRLSISRESFLLFYKRTYLWFGFFLCLWEITHEASIRCSLFLSTTDISNLIYLIERNFDVIRAGLGLGCLHARFSRCPFPRNAIDRSTDRSPDVATWNREKQTACTLYGRFFICSQSTQKRSQRGHLLNNNVEKIYKSRCV